MGDFLKTSVPKDYAKPSDEATIAATKDLIQKSKALFPPVKPAGEGEEGGEEGVAAIGNVPDIHEEAKHWQWAGISFGEYDMLLLQKSLKQLVTKTASPQIRFWGKIRGTEKDYYIAEGVLEAGEAAED